MDQQCSDVCAATTASKLRARTVAEQFAIFWCEFWILVVSGAAVQLRATAQKPERSEGEHCRHHLPDVPFWLCWIEKIVPI